MLIVDKLLEILFYNIFSVPFIVYFFGTFSLIFLIKNRGFHIRKMPYVLSYIRETKEGDSVSTFAIMMTCVGTVLGIGNILGGVMSVKLAGPGVLFWIVVSCFVLSSITYTEASTCLNYKINNPNARGNISYFLIRKNFKFGFLFALIYLSFFCFGYFCNGILQTQQMFSILLNDSQKCNFLAHSFVAFFIFLLLFKGFHIFAKFMKFVVPFMFIMYVSIALRAILISDTGFIGAINVVISDAFSFKSGAVGFSIGYAIQRLCFACDVGTGLTGTIVSVNNADPKKRGVISVFEVFIVGLIVCLTGLVIISNNVYKTDYTGVAAVVFALTKSGPVSQVLFKLSIALFAVTTSCSCCYLVISGLKTVCKSKILSLLILIVYSVCIFFVWKMQFTKMLGFVDLSLIVCSLINTVNLSLCKRVK